MVNKMARIKPAFDIRPICHYTTKKGWTNDPNGLVYDEEKQTYHLFAQYSKHVENDGIFGWIHAISKDLINWEEIDVPILSNDKGAAWSGGAVIDHSNTSGLFNNSVPRGSRMVCFVTYQSKNPKIGIVYSLDQGKTWIEHPEFVIKNENNRYTNEFRDPKVIWYENKELPKGGKWLLIVGGFTTIKLFSSDNLLDWKYESEILDVNGNTVDSECPDILKLPLDGDKNNIKYIVSTGGTSYIVGNLSVLDGKIIFKGEQESRKFFSGPKLWTNRGELYATQSFFNDKYGRTVLLSWVVDRTASLIEGKDWNGAQSLPMEVKLLRKNEGMAINLYPVEELNNHRGRVLEDKKDIVLDNQSFEINDLNNNKYDLELELELGTSKEINIQLSDDVVTYNCVSHTLCFIPDSKEYIASEKVEPKKEILKLRIIIDALIVEIYTNDGECNLHGMINPLSLSNIRISAKDGLFTIKNIKMYALNKEN